MVGGDGFSRGMGAPTELDMAELEARHRHWRQEHVPLLYDWLLSRKCPWPSACVQFGSGVDVHETYCDRTIYLSERTGEMPDANTLLVANARVANEHVTMSTSVAKKWSDSVYREPLQASDFRIVKRIIHPGEVNRIRELREGIVVTHSDHPHLFVWDTEKQTNRKEVTSKETPPNVPDLTLTGHTANAEYAVESAENGKVVASGGDDTNVLIWHLEDYQTLLNSGGGSKLANRAQFSGHTDTVEGIAFKPQESRQLCSGGDDKSLLFWDSRKQGPTGRIAEAHQGDVNCVDWSPNGLLVASGGADHRIRIWDVRQLSQSTGITSYADLKEHTGQINEVQFQPQQNSSILGSCSTDGQVLLWDVSKVVRDIEEDTGELHNMLVFRHFGHLHAVAEFQWNPSAEDPWCIASVSEDEERGTKIRACHRR